MKPTAVITGGAGEIGRALALALNEDGFHSHLVDKDPSVMEVARAVGATSHVIDLTDWGGLSDLESLDRVDLLVNGVGTWPLLPLDDLTPSVWRQLVSVNLDASYYASWACRRGLRNASGSIVNIASAVAMKGHAEMIHYAAAKAGVIGLTRSLALALGVDGVRVNAVAPGLVATDRNAELWGERRSVFRGARALDIDLEVSDVIASIRYLGSPSAHAITGQTLVVDGGSVLH